MRPLVWLRADLRLDDHAALDDAATRARGSGGDVVAVFVVSAAQWRAHDWADARVELLRRSLIALSDALAARNVPLRLIDAPHFGDVPDALAQLADALDRTALVFHREHEVNEQRRDAAVAERFRADGRDVRVFDDQCILPPGSVRTQDGAIYKVYTPFRKRWLDVHAASDASAPQPPIEAPSAAMACDPDPIPDRFGDFDPSALRDDLWPAGEAAARARLDAFVASRAGTYHARRDTPSVPGTSELSAALALGLLSPRRALREARVANDDQIDGGDDGLSGWMRQLIWRDFYRHILDGFPRISMNRPFQLHTEAVAWRDDGDELAAWQAGRTGYPIVDAGMRQLARTGWMHNRLRMITAMFLSKHLLLDWRLGERHFMRHLIDGDLANNNGGWQWSASTGTDAAPYFRIFNPWTQGKRFDADGGFIRRFVPELADAPKAALHDPRRLAAWRSDHPAVDYPSPIVEHKTGRARALAAFKELAS
ncbi:MAG: deoxyribodipyrimidine photo-lyase [Acidobacteriota bacterium]